MTVITEGINASYSAIDVAGFHRLIINTQHLDLDRDSILLSIWKLALLSLLNFIYISIKIYLSMQNVGS